MSSSDVEEQVSSSVSITDAKIEKCLHDVVRVAIKSGEEITIRLARSRAEEILGLEADFFKDGEEWRQKSKDLINAAVEEDETLEEPKKIKPSSKPKIAQKAGVKRESDEPQEKQKKKVKRSPARDTGDSDGDATRTNVAAQDESSSAASAHASKLSEGDDRQDSTVDLVQANDGESDLSSVIDDAPPRKKRQRKSVSPQATKSKAPKSTKATSQKSTKELTPDEEEIKRLQGWLIKCGIRKLWHRELAPYSTSKEKIKHLKGMLADVGMTGRYSTEKAKQIKESRELAAELEAAKDFNEQWGQGSGDEEEETAERAARSKEKEKDAPPKRRMPKGLVDFGDSDGESE